jgi:hypothetical protein
MDQASKKEGLEHGNQGARPSLPKMSPDGEKR